MRKSKLDKLIQTEEDKKQLNYSIIDKAKDQLCEQNRLRESKRSFQWGTLAKILVPMCCVLIVIVACVVTYYPSSDDSSLPSKIEAPKLDENPDGSEEKHYSKTNEFRNIQSVEQFNQDKNISLRYFDLSDIEENLLVYVDKENEKDKDVLLLQSIVLLETYEEIKMYVELQDSYIIDFLHRFEDLEDECEIGGIELKYETSFDEYLMLFCTRTTFEFDGFKYRVEFFLEDQEQWHSYLAEIL